MVGTDVDWSSETIGLDSIGTGSLIRPPPPLLRVATARGTERGTKRSAIAEVIGEGPPPIETLSVPIIAADELEPHLAAI
jgi:hypothetical protein